MLNTLVYALIAAFLLWAVVVGFMYTTQDQQLYFPSSQLEATPTNIDLNYDDVHLSTSDGVHIHGWYIPAAEQNAPLLLFFHGNAGNISHRLESIRLFHQLGLNQLIIDYRGYGLSEGVPSEEGLYADAAAAWQYARDKQGFKPNGIILFGRSLGAAVAAELAASRPQPPGALILESGFTSAQDLAAELLPWLPVRQLMRAEYNTRQYLQQTQTPVLIAHARADEIVPYAHGQALYEVASAPKTWVTLKGGHNDGFIRSQPQYQQQIQDFLTQALEE